MRITTPRGLKYATVALLASSALVLGACGKSEETDSADKTVKTEKTTSSTTTTSSAKASAQATTSSAPSSAAAAASTSAEEAPKPEAAKEEQPAPQAEAPAPAPADPQAAAAIDGLVRGIYNTATMGDFLAYIPNNTCNAVIQQGIAEGGPDVWAVPQEAYGIPLADMPGYRENPPRVDAVDNVRVNGERATATVTATADGRTTTEEQHFLFEDGRWKFCS